jgi:hypothetical protein
MLATLKMVSVLAAWPESFDTCVMAPEFITPCGWPAPVPLMMASFTFQRSDRARSRGM